MSQENPHSQMRKGTLEYCVLLLISQGEIYSSDIIVHLTNANLLVVEGTLYPLLTRLKNSKFLNYRWVESTQGPPRKYFSITEEGQSYLNELEEAWQSLVNSINNLKNIQLAP